MVESGHQRRQTVAFDGKASAGALRAELPFLYGPISGWQAVLRRSSLIQVTASIPRHRSVLRGYVAIYEDTGRTIRSW